MYKNKNVLVTGGAGFLGGVVTKKLCEHVGKVTVVDTFRNRNYGIRSLMAYEHLQVLKEDAFDTHLAPYDYIINLAAVAGEQVDDIIRDEFETTVDKTEWHG